MNKKFEFGFKDFNPPYIIPELGSLKINLFFAPQKEGLASKSMEIQSNAHGNAKYIVPLRGEGYNPEAIYDKKLISYNFKITPNPIKDKAKLIITIFENQDKPIVFNLFDLSGKSIDSFSINSPRSGEYTIDLDLSNYDAGMYYISDQAGNYFLRFLKN
jgi:hypothetical protein